MLRGLIHSFILVFSVTIILISDYAHSQSAVQRKLAKIDQALKGYESNLMILEEEEKRLSDEIDHRTSRIEAIREERLNLKTRLERVQKSLLRMADDIKSARQRLIVIRARIKARAKSLYLSRQHMQSMVGQALQRTGADMVKLGYFMTKIQSSDLHLIKKFELLTRARQEKEKTLKEMYVTREKLDGSLLLEEEKETSLLVEQEKAHSEISRQRRMVESARDKLKHEYEKIETILVSLTNTSSPKLVRKASMKGGYQGEGQGLGSYTKWPVEGTVVHKYGQYRVSTFKDVVFHKGVLFDVPAGTRVRALENGIVRFIGIMPKYGLVLLLDHGRREYSLYGKLSEARVSVGSEVSQDQILGSTGEKVKDEEGSFYFEVRHGGKPVNPGQYVKVDSRS